MYITAVLENSEDIIINADMVGIGSTRKVYRYKEFVIKTFLHPLGLTQSKNESRMYEYLKFLKLEEHIAPVLFINQHYSVQPFYQQLPLKNNCTYDIDLETDPRITQDLKVALNILNKELDGFDFKDSGNYGLNKEGELVLIDYGMTKQLYEEQWVPLAEAGKLPQIYFEKCQVCGIEKELRMYGEADKDCRCVECGKEY